MTKIASLPILITLGTSLALLQCISSFHINIPQSHNTLSRLFSSSSTSNVVLRPTSDNPEAFDSSKIGSARVHRYTNPSSTDDDDTEYVMWYHGRSINDKDTDSNLAPLSTGNIGYATSRNGLHWEKVIEDGEQKLCLAINVDEWWGFDTKHVGLGQVLQPTASSRAMQTDVGVYMMYYMGGNGEETSMSDYIASSDIAEDKIMGMNMCIGIAISQDGVHWGRIEGDSPNGSVIEPDDKELYCAWPDVIKLDTKMYVMHYSTLTNPNKQKCIHSAISEDGFKWEKQGSCITPSIEEDESGVARSHVMYDYSKKQFTMFYDGVSAKDNKHRIFAAVSSDGINDWKKLGVILDLPNDDDAWDGHGISNPHAIELDDGSIRMYYIGQDTNGNTALGVARCMQDKESESYQFEREQAEFAF